MSQILHSVLTAIGQTPLIDLASLVQAPCFAKMEFLNPGGSIKDRIALEMIQGAIQTGQLQPGMTILEATSGNTGIALAMVGGQLGYPVTIVMPENMSQERQQMIRAFGGRLILTPAELSIGGAVAKAKQLYTKGGYYMPMQFENPDNVRAQEKMALEALEQLDCQVDVVISGIGSGGSLQGMANVLRKVNPDCRVVAVEPLGVSSLKQDPPGMHAIQGIGDGFIPELFDPEVVTDIIEVSDQDAIACAKELAQKMGLFVGISSGANLYGAKQIVQTYGSDLTILTLLPDRGERYFSTGIFA